MNRGTSVLFHAEEVARNRMHSNHTWDLLIHREARLSADLSVVKERVVRSIDLVIHPGFPDERVVPLGRDSAEALRRALAEALAATSGEDWS